MKVDIAPSLAHVAGLESFDVPAYGDMILDRFSNPSVKDTLERVAQDGSSKYANQLIPIVVENQQQGTNITLLAIAVATWVRHLHGDDENGKELLVSDGRRDELMELMRRPDGIDELVKDSAIFGGLDPNSGPAFLDDVVRLYRSICANGVRQTLRVALDALRAP